MTVPNFNKICEWIGVGYTAENKGGRDECGLMALRSFYILKRDHRELLDRPEARGLWEDVFKMMDFDHPADFDRWLAR